jgi:hypothetical protein
VEPGVSAVRWFAWLEFVICDGRST